MKALVSLYCAFPPDSGAASVTYRLARNLSGPRLLIQIGERDDRVRLEPGFEVVTLAAASSTALRKLAAMPRLLRRIAAEVEAAGAEIVILEGSSWAVYMWLLARRLSAVKPRPRLVYHAHNVEYDLRRGRNGRLVAAAARRAERSLVRGSDFAFACSETDASRFAALYGLRPRLLPNGVDTDEFDGSAGSAPAANRDVLFMGLPTYPPNAEAIRFLVEQVFPLVVAAEPRARLVVTGKGVQFARPWLATPGIVPFDRLPEFIRSHRLGLAPIFSGSGTRLKILEYMASGLPVVATSKGAEGLDLQEGRDYLRREDAPGFAEAILSLFSDDAAAGCLAAAGRRAVRERYNWQALVREFERSLGSKSPLPT